MSLLSRLASRKPAGAPRPRRQPTVRLSVERLEDRCVPSANFGSALDLGSSGGPGPNVPKTVVTDSAGDVYVAGSLVGTTAVNFAPASANPVTLNPVNYKDNTAGYIAKYSPGEQQLLWVEPTTGGNDDTRPEAMAVDGSGNVYATVLDHTTGITSLNKYDPNGNLLWSNNLNNSLGISPNNTYAATGIAVDSSGNIYLTGLPSYSSLTSYVAKFSGANGGLIWNKTYGQGNSYGNSESYIAVDPSGNVWLTGTYQGKANFNPNGTFNLTSDGSKKTGYVPNAYALKLDTNGNFLWAGSLGTDTLTQASGITVDGAGNVYLAGVYQLGKSQNDFDPGPNVVPLNGGTSYLVKLNANGAYQWGDSWNAVNLAFTGGNNILTLDSAGNIYLTGQYSGTANFNPGSGQYLLTAPAGTDQAFVLKLDNGGNFVWAASTSSTSGNSRGYSVAVDGMGDVYTAGGFSTPTDFDPNSGTYDLTPAGYNPNTDQPVANGFLWQLTQS